MRRNPAVLPTGKNIHALDPQSIPTTAAVKSAEVRACCTPHAHCLTHVSNLRPLFIAGLIALYLWLSEWKMSVSMQLQCIVDCTIVCIAW